MASFRPMVKMASFRPMVKTSGDKDWVGNGLRFATHEEALANAKDLMSRWMAVLEYTVHESEDPVAHRWVDGKLESMEKASG